MLYQVHLAWAGFELTTLEGGWTICVWYERKGNVYSSTCPHGPTKMSKSSVEYIL
jgi:hypothetical protein